MKNQITHFKLALFVNAIICLILSFTGFRRDILFIISITIAGIFFSFTLLWELYQYDEAPLLDKPFYLKNKWKDIIGDILAGNIGWLAPFMICYFWIWQ